MNLHQIDLNLLLLFDALYRCRSVSTAANEIYLSQSAFSHGLSRLRKRLADELFVRINNVMEPTPFAHELANHITPALAQLHNGLNNSLVFNPSTSDIELTFAATDYTQFSLLPKLIGHISKVAPNIRITVVPSEDKVPMAKLVSGELDYVLGFSHEIEKSSTIERQTWLQDSNCTISRKNHPQLKTGLTLDKFLTVSHVRVSPWGEKQGIVDQQLARQGLKRHVALQLPSVMAAPYTIENSDYLLTFPRLMAEHVAKIIDIDIYTPPIAIPDYQLNVYWHKINNNKASHQWLRHLISQL
ncbi:LysR family transcriptional regulator [Colwellia psychrerythraea]|uniref:Transcriptional regulator, LysR family n=1 Tax=Colwellia psychrerythraea TaxID=28229 RepID=A0A099KNQ0_COLPS|nr:LysR family transcriptional regulator [Colwellia psychrerythraea]KGJ91532.1 transcriptional regulator, LysR family [Colwellia psychrerythraea]